MALSYRARRGWSLVILLIGLPLYIVAAVSLMNAIQRLPIWLEVPAYVVLGVAWILPFRAVFRGIGQADPDAVKSNPPEASKKAEGTGPSA